MKRMVSSVNSQGKVKANAIQSRWRTSCLRWMVSIATKPFGAGNATILMTVLKLKILVSILAPLGWRRLGASAPFVIMTKRVNLNWNGASAWFDKRKLQVADETETAWYIPTYTNGRGDPSFMLHIHSHQEPPSCRRSGDCLIHTYIYERKRRLMLRVAFSHPDAYLNDSIINSVNQMKYIYFGTFTACG